MEPTTRRSELLARVAHLPLFAGLDRRSLMRVADELEWIALPGGAELFHEQDQPDAVYVLLAGCLGAFRSDADRLQLIGRIHPGETVGEMALLSGHPRTATVRALRDSEIVRFSLAAFERLARAHPEAMLAVARIAVERLERTLQGRQQEPPPRTLAVLPAHAGIDLDGLVQRLGQALARFGDVAVVDLVNFLQAPIAALHSLEMENEFVIYVGQSGHAAWNERCRRQADCLLLVADAELSCSAVSEPPLEGDTQQSTLLVLLQPGRIVAGAARASGTTHRAAVGRGGVLRRRRSRLRPYRRDPGAARSRTEHRRGRRDIDRRADGCRRGAGMGRRDLSPDFSPRPGRQQPVE
jgi:NTE family protein